VLCHDEAGYCLCRTCGFLVMHASRGTHPHVLKRIFKDLYSTIDHSLLFKFASKIDFMTAFCDAD